MYELCCYFNIELLDLSKKLTCVVFRVFRVFRVFDAYSACPCSYN